MKGRKKTPDSLKKLRGTDQPCRMGGGIQVDPVEDLDKIIDSKGLTILRTARAKRIFKEKANQLIKLQIFTEIDYEQLAIYAYTIDLIFICMAEIRKGRFKEIKDEQGLILRFVQNPYIKLYRELIPQAQKLASDFGFTPSARMKFNTSTKETDPLQDLLNEFK